GLGAMRRLAPPPRAGESKRYVALLPPAGGRTRSDTSSCPSPHAEDSKRYVVLPPPPPAGEGRGGGRAGATQPASHRSGTDPLNVLQRRFGILPRCASPTALPPSPRCLSCSPAPRMRSPWARSRSWVSTRT